MPFKDLAEPQALLDPAPKDPAYATDQAHSIADSLALLSPSGLVGEISTWIFDENIFESAAKNFTGDWNAVHKCGIAFRQVADASAAIGLNIKVGNEDLDQTWNGNAADAAYVYFRNLSDVIRNLEDELRNVGDQYVETAERTFYIGQVVAGILAEIVDAIVVAIAGSVVLIALSAGSAIPLVAGFVWVYAEGRWAEITGQIGDALFLSDRAGVALTLFSSAPSDVQSLPFPQPYDHPWTCT